MSESSDTVMQLRALHLSDILQDGTPKQKLQRLLSTKSTASAISTTSSFAQRQQDASEQPEDQSYRYIGAGSCGIIYECTGTTFAFKVARNDNLQLWNDFQMHSVVMAMFTKHEQLTADIRVPRCKTFILPEDKGWWAANISKFPEGVQASMVLCAERILPLPKIVRELLLTEYCPAHLLEKARMDPMNSDCLVRLYLGRRRRTQITSRPQRFFTLRNLPLYLDQMLDLQLEIDEFASNMAKALAVMHWEARIDADDVEFVLGSSPTFSAPVRELDLAVILAMQKPTSTLNLTNSAPNFCRRQVHMWLLDFNLCSSISMDEEGVDKAVKAFYKNDPYFPRPLAEASRDQQLWKTFRDQYLRASDKVLGNGPERDLPSRFIEKVIAEQQARMSQRAESTSSKVPPED